MRIAAFSDLHGNAEALRIATSAVADEVDEFVLAGDAMHDYRFSNEVVETIQEVGIRYVVGNHELGLLGPLGERARSVSTIRRRHLEYVAEAPRRIDTVVGGKRLTVVHASPWHTEHRYLYPDDPTWDERGDTLDMDILILGHTHSPMVRTIGRTLVVNPGALGAEARGSGDRSMVSYAVIDTDSGEVEIRRFRNPSLPPAPTND